MVATGTMATMGMTDTVTTITGTGTGTIATDVEQVARRRQCGLGRIAFAGCQASRAYLSNPAFITHLATARNRLGGSGPVRRGNQ